MTKCAICERRPAKTGGICSHCGNRIAAESNAKAKNVPQHFLTYRDNVVGLYSNGNRTLKARLLRRSAEHLPKRQTIDLNRYCSGYTREMIKRFKACVLKLSQA